MMKKLLLALLCLAAPASFAAGGLAIGAKMGTLGPGIEICGYLMSNLNLRVGGNYLPLSVDGEADEVDYDVELNFANALATLDWHPFNNNFRISAGFALNNNELEMIGDLNEDTEIGDREYSPSEIGRLKGSATFDEYAPYLGIGFGNAVADDVDLTFSFDFGLLFQGGADIELTANGTASGDPVFQANLRKEEKDAQDVADDFKIYPVISFGICYYFW
jgi:hypothetical protein